MTSKLYSNQGSTDIKLMKDGYLAGGFFIVNHCKLFIEPPSKRLEDFGFIIDQDNKYVKGSSLPKPFGKKNSYTTTGSMSSFKPPSFNESRK